MTIESLFCKKKKKIRCYANKMLVSCKDYDTCYILVNADR